MRRRVGKAKRAHRLRTSRGHGAFRAFAHPTGERSVPRRAPHQLPEAPPPPDEPPPPEKLPDDPDELDAYEPPDTRRPRRSYILSSKTLSHSQKPVRVLRCGSR